MVQHLNEWTHQSATLSRDARRVNAGNAVLLSPLLLKDLHKKEVVMLHPGVMTAGFRGSLCEGGQSRKAGRKTRREECKAWGHINLPKESGPRM